MLTALLVRGATLPGASEGIRFYLEPKWEKVLDYQVITSVFRTKATGSRLRAVPSWFLVRLNPGNLVYCSITSLLPNTYVCQLFYCSLSLANLCHVMFVY